MAHFKGFGWEKRNQSRQPGRASASPAESAHFIQGVLRDLTVFSPYYPDNYVPAARFPYGIIDPAWP
jgi:hypothetical protein